jgi:AcrR family transcriptional regulator
VARAQPLDPRIQRSRQALENSLRRLLADYDLAQISVSDITEHGGVHRSTFYEHYCDLHDLAAAACASLFDELVAAIPLAGQGTASSGVNEKDSGDGLFHHVAAHARLYRTLLGPDGSALVINHLMRRIAIAVHVSRTDGQAGPATHADDAEEIPHDINASFVAGAVIGCVIEWLRHDCRETPEQMAEAVRALLRGVACPGPRGPGRGTSVAQGIHDELMTGTQGVTRHTPGRASRSRASARSAGDPRP